MRLDVNLMGKTGVYQKGTKRKRCKPSDKPYLVFLRKHHCCVCGGYPTEAAHVRLGGRGGMGMKPLFSAVPLCRDCHTVQHTQGHSELMSTDDWLKAADIYLNMWKKQALVK